MGDEKAVEEEKIASCMQYFIRMLTGEARVLAVLRCTRSTMRRIILNGLILES